VPLPLAPRLSLSFFLSLLLSPPLHTSFSIMLARARLFVLDRACSCLFIPFCAPIPCVFAFSRGPLLSFALFALFAIVCDLALQASLLTSNRLS
jgi:hypothetical protein